MNDLDRNEKVFSILASVVTVCGAIIGVILSGIQQSGGWPAEAPSVAKPTRDLASVNGLAAPSNDLQTKGDNATKAAKRTSDANREQERLEHERKHERERLERQLELERLEHQQELEGRRVKHEEERARIRRQLELERLEHEQELERRRVKCEEERAKTRHASPNPARREQKREEGVLVFRITWPVLPGVDGWVELDGRRVANWEVGTTRLVVSVASGSHHVAVYSIYRGRKRKFLDTTEDVRGAVTRTFVLPQ